MLLLLLLFNLIVCYKRRINTLTIHSVSLPNKLYFMAYLLLFLYFKNRDCRVVRDPQTLKSKGYGFVSFVKKSVSCEIKKVTENDI